MLVISLVSKWSDLKTFIDADTDEVVPEVDTVDGDMDDDIHSIEVKMNGKRIKRLRELFSTIKERALLKLEMNVISLVCHKLIKYTYILEGDGAVSLVAYDIIQDVIDWFNSYAQNLTFPALRENGQLLIESMQKCISTYVTTIQAPNPSISKEERDQIREEATSVVRTIVDAMKQYFEGTVLVKLNRDIKLYHACRLMNPIKMRELKTPVEDFVETIKIFKRFSLTNIYVTESIDGFKDEWTKFLRVCSELPINEGDGEFVNQIKYCETFWQTQYYNFPALSNLARFALTIVPSSGASERSFSLLKNSFSLAQMQSALMDYVTATVMAQYNGRKANFT